MSNTNLEMSEGPSVYSQEFKKSSPSITKSLKRLFGKSDSRQNKKSLSNLPSVSISSRSLENSGSLEQVSAGLSSQNSDRWVNISNVSSVLLPILEKELPGGLQIPPPKLPCTPTRLLRSDVEHSKDVKELNSRGQLIVFIPIVKDIAKVMAKSIDKFSSYAEALMVPTLGYRFVGFISMSRKILKHTNQCDLDVGGLIQLLEHVVLSCIESCYQRSGRSRHARLPKLSKTQKKSLKQFLTFTPPKVKVLKQKVKELEQNIQTHQAAFKKLSKAHELYRKEMAHMCALQKSLYACQNNADQKNANNGAIFTLWQREGVNQRVKKMEIKHARKTSELKCLSEQIDALSKTEKDERTSVVTLSNAIVEELKYMIKDRMAYGLGCLCDTVLELVPEERETAYTTLINIALNQMDKTAETIVQTCSASYVCTDIESFRVSHGPTENIPVPYMQNKTTPFNIKSYSKLESNSSFDEETISNMPTENKSVNNEKSDSILNDQKMNEQEIGGVKSKKEETSEQSNNKESVDGVGKLKTFIVDKIDAVLAPDESKNQSSKLPDPSLKKALTDDVVQYHKPIKSLPKLTVLRGPRFRQCPGFLNPTQGRVINLQIRVVDTNISYGWYRKMAFFGKTWGFFKRDDIIFREWNIETRSKLATLMGFREWVHEENWINARKYRSRKPEVIASPMFDKCHYIEYHKPHKVIQPRSYQNWDKKSTIFQNFDRFTKEAGKDLNTFAQGATKFGQNFVKSSGKVGDTMVSAIT